MAGNREVVEVLRLVAADDAFIAREFQHRFFRMGLRGGLAGGAAALGFIGLLGLLATLWRQNAAGDQIEILFGTFALSWLGYASIALVAAMVALITGLVSRLTVRRFLRGYT